VSWGTHFASRNVNLAVTFASINQLWLDLFSTVGRGEIVQVGAVRQRIPSSYGDMAYVLSRRHMKSTYG